MKLSSKRMSDSMGAVINISVKMEKFFEEFKEMIPNKSEFVREAVHHYIPVWCKKLEEYNQLSRKYLNEE